MSACMIGMKEMWSAQWMKERCGETDRLDASSEIADAGGLTDLVDALLDALLVVVDVGDNGKAGWMEARPSGTK